MKIATKIVIFMLALVIMVMPAVACGEPTSTPTPTPKKITLADAPIVLDLSPLLPASFEHLDAASEGFSNKDLGLGPDFSEVELFLSEEPYQVIYATLGIFESRIDQTGIDAFIRDREQVESVVVWGLESGAAEEGIELSSANIEVTYHQIGNSAVLGSGTFGAMGMTVGFDELIFRSGAAYVIVASYYYSEENQSLVPLAREIDHRISMFSQ